MRDAINWVLEGGNIVVLFLFFGTLVQFYRGMDDEPGGVERRRAKHFLYALIALSLYANLENRHELRVSCDQGDEDACVDLEIQDFEDQQSAERFGR